MSPVYRLASAGMAAVGPAAEEALRHRRRDTAVRLVSRLCPCCDPLMSVAGGAASVLLAEWPGVLRCLAELPPSQLRARVPSAAFTSHVSEPRNPSSKTGGLPVGPAILAPVYESVILRQRPVGALIDGGHQLEAPPSERVTELFGRVEGPAFLSPHGVPRRSRRPGREIAYDGKASNGGAKCASA